MITAIVEMPRGTKYKYEVCKQSGGLVLDRPVNTAVPHSYGFIPKTYCEDGDPIDVFIAAWEPIPSLTSVKVQVVGLIDCTDGGFHDPKLLAYVEGDEFAKQLIPLTQFTAQCLLYLETYKKGLVINGVFGEKEALESLKKAREEANANY